MFFDVVFDLLELIVEIFGEGCVELFTFVAEIKNLETV